MHASAPTSLRPSSDRLGRWVGLGLGLLLAVTACKSAEDRPDTDPLNDPWLDEIEAEEVAVAATPDPAADPTEPTTAVAPDDGEPPVAPDDGAEVEPGEPAEADSPEELAGASVPTSKSDGGSASASASASGSVKAGQPEPTPGDQPAAVPGEQPADSAAAAPSPQPAPQPAAKPEPVEPAKPAPITIADYDGTFRFSGGSSQRKALEEAIEFGANQVAGIIRGIARKRLTKTQIIDDEIKMSISGDKITFNWSNGSTMTCVIGGPKVSMSFKGDKYLGRVLEKGSKMIVVFDAPDAVKTLVYVLSADRQKLTVHHKLDADQLSEPVTFKLSYTRK
ncbi:hypothetical protein [Enhygromyxa salina]|uniref:Uncharacterized protein n=1 Tax=Enhygromyxa salina TaxID=215803 RepID=A0A2S9Y7P5_9BACT|nr:hypothetical protein [Enhygromyxa salina]PRQ01117.1 hypothetical protein ENSA7_57220 [Enhygromyxa salina]